MISFILTTKALPLNDERYYPIQNFMKIIFIAFLEKKTKKKYTFFIYGNCIINIFLFQTVKLFSQNEKKFQQNTLFTHRIIFKI